MAGLQLGPCPSLRGPSRGCQAAWGGCGQGAGAEWAAAFPPSRHTGQGPSGSGGGLSRGGDGSAWRSRWTGTRAQPARVSAALRTVSHPGLAESESLGRRPVTGSRRNARAGGQEETRSSFMEAGHQEGRQRAQRLWGGFSAPCTLNPCETSLFQGGRAQPVSKPDQDSRLHRPQPASQPGRSSRTPASYPRPSRRGDGGLRSPTPCSKPQPRSAAANSTGILRSPLALRGRVHPKRQCRWGPCCLSSNPGSTLLSCVTLGEYLRFSVPKFPHMQNGAVDGPPPALPCEDETRDCV